MSYQRRRGPIRHILLRRLAVFLAVIPVLAAGLALAPPAAAVAREIVVIHKIEVGNPVMGTRDACNGWVQHGRPVVPMTVVASFIVSDGGAPTGPYAVGMWGGGFGSSDDHFGTEQGKARTQIFHILLTTDQLGGWHGAGYYNVQAIVQDVGLAGGFAAKSINTYIGPPSPTTADVKCTMTPPLGPEFVLNQVRDAAIGKLKAELCPICSELKGTWDKIAGYSEVMNDLLFKTIIDDPPDRDFQQLAEPEPAPFLEPPAGLSNPQKVAYSELAGALSEDIGIARALFTTVNRIWGADNASDAYWHVRQVQHLADLADEGADALEELPDLYAALGASMADDLPALPVSSKDVAEVTGNLALGFDPDRADVLNQLGVGPAEQRSMASAILSLVDPADVAPQDGAAVLGTTRADGIAESLRIMRDWARAALEQTPPVVSSIDVHQLPASGGQLVNLTGANLQDVSGVNFGPSEPGRGQAYVIGCAETSCTVRAPEGRGTVDVVAIGPGGPSAPKASTRLQYVEPAVPHVTHVFPADGPASGGTWVTVFGSGLAGGTPYFGPSVADDWTCSDDLCTAKAPGSASTTDVHITVKNSSGISATSPQDVFTYSATAPPAPPAPVVTSLSPATGSHLGGQRVEVVGQNFRGITSGQLVKVDDTFTDVDLDDLAVVDNTHLRFTVPRMAKGTFDLILYGPGGTSTPAAADRFVAVGAAPTITGVSPKQGPDIGGTQVTVTGTNLTDALLDVGDEFVRDEVCTATTCTFTTPPLSQDEPEGPVHISALTEDGSTTDTAADVFTYQPGPAPVITDVTPRTGPDTGKTTVVVEGANLNGGVVRFDGLGADALAGTGDCSMTTCLVATPKHGAGTVDLTIDTHGGTATTPYAYVHQGRPVVTSITPTSGWARNVDTIKLQGHNLEGGKVYFGDVLASNAECSESKCTIPFAPWPSGPGTVHVTVRTASGTSRTTPADEYTWYAPTVTSMSPATGWNDGQAEVTITGTRLKGGHVQFGDRTATPACASETTCTVLAPKTSTTGPVTVQVTAEDGSTRVEVPTRFTYTTRPLPTVTAISPSHGSDKGGDDVTVTGTNLLNGKIYFNGAAISTSTDVCTNTSCTARAPGHGTDEAVVVTVQTTAGTSPGTGVTYTYEPAGTPVVTGVSPATSSTEGGTTVTVTGHALTLATIKFGTVAGTGTTCSSTKCTTTSPPHAAGAVHVTATTGAGTSATSAADQLTYVLPAAPEITGVSPANGPQTGGQKVQVSGRHLYGATLSFGGVPATAVSCTDVLCDATQPAGTGTVHVVATTDGGSSAATAADQFRNDAVSVGRVDVPGVTGANGGGTLARGAGGDLWFAVTSQNRIGRIAGDGTITSWVLPTAGSQPGGVTLGPDGRTWFTEKQVDKIGAIDADGHIEEFQVPGVDNDLRYLTAGPDGRLWFTLATSGAVGAMTTEGEVSLYPLPDPYVVPYHLTTGADGRIWFTEWNGDHVGAITTDGALTEYQLPVSGTTPWQIVPGPDDRLWLTQAEQRELLAVDTDGRVTAYRLPVTTTNPQGLTLGPDGRLWFVAPDSEQISAFDPATSTTVDYAFPTGTPDVVPKYVGMDRHGDLWVTGTSGKGLLKVAVGLPADRAPRVTGINPRYGGAGAVLGVTGSALAGASRVTVGGVAATFTVVDPAHLRVTAPAGVTGAADVVVTTGAGTSPVQPADVFTYGAPPAPAPVVASVSPPSGSTAGGTTVTITGRHLSGGAVSFGGQQVAGATCTATSCTATAPAHAAGTVHVRVTTGAGSSAPVADDQFTYLAPPPPKPVVTGVSPRTGPDQGGTQVTITGTNLQGGTVRFGLRAAEATCGASSCTATSPADGYGTVDVQVMTGGGTSALTAADRFTYVPSGSTPSTVVLHASDTTVTVGEDVDLTADLTPAAATGTVTFLDGGIVVGSATAVDGEASLTLSTLAKGTHQLTANYAGDDVYAPDTSAPVAVTVTAGPGADTQTFLEADPDQVEVDEDVHLLATVFPDDATGTVTFADTEGVLGTAELTDGPDGNTAELDVSFSEEGTHTILAAYEGDDDHEPSQSTSVQVQVGATPPAQVDMDLSASPTSSRERQQVTFDATVHLAGAPGGVTFVDDFGGGATLGTVKVTGGHAKLATTALAAGVHQVTAVYADDDGRFGFAGPVRVTVAKATVDPPPPPPPPPATPTLPGAPAQATAKAGHGSVKLVWDAPASTGGAAIVQYVVEVRKGSKVLKTITTASAATRLKVKKLKAGQKYRFRVAAVTAAGQGAFSPWSKKVTPKP